MRRKSLRLLTAINHFFTEANLVTSHLPAHYCNCLVVGAAQGLVSEQHAGRRRCSGTTTLIRCYLAYLPGVLNRRSDRMIILHITATASYRPTICLSIQASCYELSVREHAHVELKRSVFCFWFWALLPELPHTAEVELSSHSSIRPPVKSIQ